MIHAKLSKLWYLSKKKPFVKKPIVFFALFIVFASIFVGCSRQKSEIDLLLPIDFSNIPNSLVLREFNTDKIEIKIKAEPYLIELVKKQDIRYQVDLYTDLEFDPAGASESIEEGLYFIPVDEKRIFFHPSIKIININPSYLSVRLEDKITKSFNINVPYIGKPAKGYIALPPEIEPLSTELTGASSLINSIEKLNTKPVELNNANENFKKNLPLDLDEKFNFSPKNNIIVATIPIRSAITVKTIENIPVKIKNFSLTSVKVKPSKITIQIQGKAQSF